MSDPTECNCNVLHPARHPGSLPVCTGCGTALLDFDEIYLPLANGFRRRGSTVSQDMPALIKASDVLGLVSEGAVVHIDMEELELSSVEPLAEFETADVLGGELETETCLRMDFNNFDSYGMPPETPCSVVFFEAS